MPERTHTVPVDSYVLFRAANGNEGRFRIVSHREYSESYVVRGRNDTRDCWFNLTGEEVKRSAVYDESEPW